MKLRKNDIFADTDTCFRIITDKNIYRLEHGHDFCEIFIVTKGELTHCINGVEEKIHSNDVVLINNMDRHTLHGTVITEMLNIAFSVSLYHLICNLFSYNPAQKPNHKITLTTNEVSHYLEKVKELTATCEESQKEVLLKSVLTDLMGKFISKTNKPSYDSPLWFEQFIQKISDVSIFTSQMTVVYACTDKTPEHIARTFRKVLNMTLTEYLLQLRLNYAKGLLQTTNHSIVEICFECGFNNLSYFYRSFKAVYGMSPKAFRNVASIVF